MITAQKFSANLRAFSKLDEAARGLFAETCAYVMYQYHAHGNKDPFNKLQESPLPGWIKDAVKKIKLGKRDKSMTESSAEMRGDAHASMAFASQAEKRAIAKANREARAEKSETVVEKSSPKFAIVGEGDVLEISADEYATVMGLIQSMRSDAVAEVPMLKVVNG